MTWLPNKAFAEAFKLYIKTEPRSLMYHEALRKDLLVRFPRAQWEIWALCAALEEGLFLDLVGGSPALDGASVDELCYVLCQRLSLREDLAFWTVQTLAEAFGKRLVFTDKTRPSAAERSINPAPISFAPRPEMTRVTSQPCHSFESVRVPAGRYLLGTSPPDFESTSIAAQRGIIPPHTERAVTLTVPFEIGVFAVTNGLWQSIMGRRHTETGLGDDDHPVTGVTFFDAVAFCNAASRRDGLVPSYGIEGDKVSWNVRRGAGYRLPTEAEWEVACRAGANTKFANGSCLTSADANYDGQFEHGEFRATTTPVGSFKSNAWGLYDMHGNVHEWCWDWSSPDALSDMTDPIGPDHGTYRIVRGGAWTVWRSEHCASATRMAFRPDMPGFDCGFRMVKSVID